MNALAIIGFLGGLCFAYAGIPGAWQAFRQGRTQIPAGTSVSIFVGVVLLYAYLFLQHGFDPVVTITYGTEAAAWAVVIRYTFLPRRLKPATRAEQEKIVGQIAQVMAKNSPFLDLLKREPYIRPDNENQ